MFLALLDALFSVIHAVVVLANVSLWMWRRTRPLHLLLVACTAASWFGLGLVYGLGYCFLTDWHWSIKHARGETTASGSFIHYVLNDILNLPLSPTTTNWITAVGFAGVVLLSLLLNWRDRYLAARRS